MSHQPFETWLLSDIPLDSEQHQALESHLRECEDCSLISNAITQVIATLSSSHAPNPAPGFTQRWQHRLSLYRQQQQQQNMWFLTLALFSIAGLIFLMLFMLNTQNSSWFYSLSQFIASFSLFASRINQIWTVTRSLTTAFPILVPIMIIFGIGSLFAMTALVITWFSSIIRLYQPAQKGVIAR